LGFTSAEVRGYILRRAMRADGFARELREETRTGKREGVFIFVTGGYSAILLAHTRKTSSCSLVILVVVQNPTATS